MHAAIHGQWCNTKTWPTKCPSCGCSVFFFSCDHGSKVFFDKLGSPWPTHDCNTSWTRKLKRTTDKTGKITVELGEGITVSRPRDFQIDEGIVKQVRRLEKSQDQIPFAAVEPEGKSICSIVGVLREITRNACPFKKYRLDETTVGRAMLGPIGKQKMGRITVHIPPPTGTQSKSYSLWIPSELICDSRITRGLTVSLNLEGVKVHKYGYVWFSDEFDIVG